MWKKPPPESRRTPGDDGNGKSSKKRKRPSRNGSVKERLLKGMLLNLTILQLPVSLKLEEGLICCDFHMVKLVFTSLVRKYVCRIHVPHLSESDGSTAHYTLCS